jgi:nuclear pore complex protein Nup85
VVNDCGVGLVGLVPEIDQLTNDQSSFVWHHLCEEMLGTDHINLVPPVVETGRFYDLVKAGQTVSASLSPSSNSLAVFLTNTVCFLHSVSAFVCVTHSSQGPLDKNKSHAMIDDDQPVYFAGLDVAPSSERRLVRAATISRIYMTLNFT